MNDAKAMRVLKRADRLLYQNVEGVIEAVKLVEQVAERIRERLRRLEDVCPQLDRWIAVAKEARRIMTSFGDLGWVSIIICEWDQMIYVMEMEL